MTPDIKPLVAGNWKMNGMRDSLSEIRDIAGGISDDLAEKVDTLICPPATLLYVATTITEDTPTEIGAQNCHMNVSGAHTGEISADMIEDCYGSHVIVGHSERRSDNGETSAMVNEKAKAVWEAGLVAIICIGETEEERKSGRTLDVLKEQMEASIPDGADSDSTILAYEPVWAIGTGLTPTVSDIEEAHAFQRKFLTDKFGDEGAHMRILYGGSVKPANAVELMAISNVDGALVGGASLKAKDFLGICAAYTQI